MDFGLPVEYRVMLMPWVGISPVANQLFESKKASFSVVAPSESLAYPIGDSPKSLRQEVPVEIEPDIIVTAKSVETDITHGVSYWRSGVRLEYGPTSLTADTLVIRTKTGIPEIDSKPFEIPELGISLGVNEGYATGAVKVDDPDAKIQARNIRLNWNEGSRNSRLEDASIEIGALRLTAESLTQTPEGWVLTNTTLTTCRNNPPLYRVKMRTTLVVPGKRVSARGVRIAIFGQTLPTIPSFSASLDRRTKGMTIPNLAYRKDEGFGVSWNAAFLVGSDSQISGQINSFKNVLPTTQLQYSVSRLEKGSNSTALLQPRSDLDERFFYSFFKNVYTTDLEDQAGYVREKRDLWSVTTSWNVGSVARTGFEEPTFSKPIDLAREVSGPVGTYGFIAHAQAMTVRQTGDALRSRLLLNGSLSSPVSRRGRVGTIHRLDFGSFLGAGTYGWVGGEVGGTYDLSPFFRVGLGAYAYKDFGTPLYKVDQLTSMQGISLRTDLLSKSTKLSVMWQYDPVKGWYDLEYRASQVVGCLEPVLIYRRNPSDYQIGIRFRIDEVLDILQQRDFKRKKARR